MGVGVLASRLETSHLFAAPPISDRRASRLRHRVSLPILLSGSDGRSPERMEIMKGYVVRKGERWYAVIYQGLDPVSGKEKRSWHPAGETRKAAELLASRLASELNGRNDQARSLTFGSFLMTRWLPGKKGHPGPQHLGWIPPQDRPPHPSSARARRHPAVSGTPTSKGSTPNCSIQIDGAVDWPRNRCSRSISSSRPPSKTRFRKASSTATSPSSPTLPGCGRSPRMNSRLGPPSSCGSFSERLSVIDFFQPPG